MVESRPDAEISAAAPTTSARSAPGTKRLTTERDTGAFSMTSRIFSCLDSCRRELRSRSLASTAGLRGSRAVRTGGGGRPSPEIYRRGPGAPSTPAVGRRRAGLVPAAGPSRGGRLGAVSEHSPDASRPATGVASGLTLDDLGDNLGTASTVLRGNAGSAGLDASVPTCP